jgi:hypothetical protein
VDVTVPCWPRVRRRAKCLQQLPHNTAGDPSLPQGTPRPLRVEIVESSVGHEPALLAILEDIFKLAQLNWSSPETDIRLPITLRFTDQMLERFALDAEEEDDEWDDEEDDQGEGGP